MFRSCLQLMRDERSHLLCFSAITFLILPLRSWIFQRQSGGMTSQLFRIFTGLLRMSSAVQDKNLQWTKQKIDAFVNILALVLLWQLSLGPCLLKMNCSRRILRSITYCGGCTFWSDAPWWKKVLLQQHQTRVLLTQRHGASTFGKSLMHSLTLRVLW